MNKQNQHVVCQLPSVGKKGFIVVRLPFSNRLSDKMRPADNKDLLVVRTDRCTHQRRHHIRITGDKTTSETTRPIKIRLPQCVSELNGGKHPPCHIHTFTHTHSHTHTHTSVFPYTNTHELLTREKKPTRKCSGWLFDAWCRISIDGGTLRLMFYL